MSKVRKLLAILLFKVTNNNIAFKEKGKGLRVIDYPFYCWNPNVVIGNNVQLYPGVTFFGDGEIVIGDNVKIGNNVVINASHDGGIYIGDGTIIAANTYIIDSNHGMSKGILIQDQPVISQSIKIGKGCWIAANCVIGKGALLEDGVVIGANSFANSHFIKDSIYAGSPAKYIKSRK